MEGQPPPDAPSPPGADQPHRLAEWWSALKNPQREGLGLGALLLFAVPLWITLVVAMHPAWQTLQSGFLVFAFVSIVMASIGLTFLPRNKLHRLVARSVVLPLLVCFGLITVRAIVPSRDDQAPLVGNGVHHVVVYVEKWPSNPRHHMTVGSAAMRPAGNAHATPSATAGPSRQSPAISMHILGVEVTPEPAEGGTVLVTKLSFHNDGPGTSVKHIATSLLAPGASHVDHVRKAAADLTDLSGASQYDVPSYRDFTVTFNSGVIPSSVFALYQNGSTVYYVDR